MEEVSIKRPDGQASPAYLWVPPAGESAPGVVLLPEWWGVNEQIRGVAERLVGAGYRVLVPDIFHGQVAAIGDTATARRMRDGLNLVEVVDQEIRGAVVQMEERHPGSLVAAIGFCMGGALALAAAVRVRELNAAISFYGIPKPELADPRLIRIPFLGLFAKKDQSVTPEMVDTLERQLVEGGVNHELHRYDADHAFFNEANVDVYDRDAAGRAWERAIAFLQRTIGGTPM